MFPWLWIFAPTTQWPLSGAVTQSVMPDAFFDAIPPGAGVPGIEKGVFELASYGKQIGWLTDVLIEAVDGGQLRSAEARQALENLRSLREKIERLKRDHRQDQADAANALLDRMQADNPDELRRVLQRYLGGRGPAGNGAS